MSIEDIKQQNTNSALKNDRYTYNLQERLPYLTSPGYLETMGCQGLDYTNPNPSINISQLFYNDKYTIPQNSFNSFLNNLEYTFDELTTEQKEENLKKLKKFIDNVSEDKKDSDKKDSDKKDSDKKESFNSTEYYGNNKYIILVIILLILILIGLKIV